MFFALSKILFFLINPVLWVILLVLSTFLLKNNRLKKALLFFSIILFYFLSLPGFYNVISKSWEYETFPSDSINGHYKYAIVLGGILSVDEKTGTIYTDENIDRILQAILLYKNKKVDYLVITGGSGKLIDQSAKEAPEIKEFCLKFDIPDDKIIIESESRNTYENALNTKKLIDTINTKNILITSAIHMKRALACFRKQGYNLDTLSTSTLRDAKTYIPDFIIPYSKTLYKWQCLIKEIVGYYVYKLVGYI